MPTSQHQEIIRLALQKPMRGWGITQTQISTTGDGQMLLGRVSRAWLTTNGFLAIAIGWSVIAGTNRQGSRTSDWSSAGSTIRRYLLSQMSNVRWNPMLLALTFTIVAAEPGVARASVRLEKYPLDCPAQSM